MCLSRGRAIPTGMTPTTPSAIADTEEKNPDVKWYEHPETKSRARRLPPPYDNVYIGNDPRDGMAPEAARSFQAVVNVADTPCGYFEPAYPGQAMHWFPLNEVGYWGYAYLFWIVKVMEHHHALGHRIYLHCHSGAYRSPTAAQLWLLYRGHTDEEVITILFGREHLDRSPGYLERRSTKPFRYGNVPPHVRELFLRMRIKPGWALASHLLSNPGPIELSREVYGRQLWPAWRYQRLWFYYQPKWWINTQRRHLRFWLRGCYRVKDENGNTEYKSKESGFLRWLNCGSPQWVRLLMWKLFE